jgi:hypothetical protein
MGFAATATYFEEQAKRERRDLERKERLSETAGFYRKLAGIAPDFPGSYRPNRAFRALERARGGNATRWLTTLSILRAASRWAPSG